MNRLFTFVLCFSLLFAPMSAQAADCANVFGSGVQNNTTGGVMKLQGNGTVFNDPDGQVETRNLDANNGGSCDSVSCSKTNTAASQLSLPAFLSTGSGTTISRSSGTYTAGGSNTTLFGEISIAGSATLDFSSSDTSYRIQQLVADENSQINFRAGDYWIEDMQITGFANVTVVGGGTARIHILNQARFDDDVTVNTGGSPGSLVIMSRGLVEFNNRAEFHGFVYSTGDVRMAIDSRVYGALSSGGLLEMNNDTEVHYDSAALADADFGSACVGVVAGVDHYAISHAGVAATCEAATVTVQAHDDSDALVEPGNSVSFTINTNTGRGDWALAGGASGALNNGTADDGVATYTWGSGHDSVAFVLTQGVETVTPHMDIDILDGDGQTDNDGDVLEDPRLEFKHAVLRFAADGVSDAIGSQITGKSSATGYGSQTITLQAVETDTDTGLCVSRLGDNQTVQMAYQCLNPTTCQGTNRVVIHEDSDTALPANPAASVSSYQNVSLDFGVDGTATFSFDYSDVGSIQLHAEIDVAASGDDPAFTFVGASNVFVVRPFGFYVDVPSNPATAIVDADSAAFTSAGSAFTTNITAVAWQAGEDDNNDGEPDSDADLSDNSATPNFGKETSPETATLSHRLISPAGGWAGTLAASDASGFDAGSASVADVSWDEVGVIQLTAKLTDSSYLGADNVTGSSENIGRFTPAYFLIENINLIRRSDFAVCADTFNYLDENFTLSFALSARNQFDDVTTNYANDETTDTDIDYAKLDTTSELNLVWEDSGGTDLSTRVAGLPTVLPWPSINLLPSARGFFNVDWVLQVQRDTVVDGPLSVPLGLAPTDDDGVTIDTALYDLDTDADTTPDHLRLDDEDLVLYFGRLSIDNAFGPETRALPMPAETQYWNATSFVTNSSDQCTNLSISTSVAGTPEGPASITVGGGTSNMTANAPAVVNGDLAISFSAPGAGNTGRIDVQLFDPAGALATGITTLPWLLFDWDNDGAFDDDPGVHTATFGRYRGNDRLIQWRED